MPENKNTGRYNKDSDIEAYLDSLSPKTSKREINISPMGAYMKMIQLQQHKNKSYENTIREAEQEKQKAIEEAKAVKADRYAFQHLGRNKTLLMIFFNLYILIYMYHSHQLRLT